MLYKENVSYPNGIPAISLSGTKDDLNEAVYLLKVLFRYITERDVHGWMGEEIKASMEHLIEEAASFNGAASEILRRQGELFTPDAVNHYYKKTLRGSGDIQYSVDDYIYNDEFYDVEDRPITFWTNTISEREEVKRRLQMYQNKMTKDLQSINSLALMDREFIKNPLLTGDEIIRFLDMTENIVESHNEN